LNPPVIDRYPNTRESTLKQKDVSALVAVYYAPPLG